MQSDKVDDNIAMAENKWMDGNASLTPNSQTGPVILWFERGHWSRKRVRLLNEFKTLISKLVAGSGGRGKLSTLETLTISRSSFWFSSLIRTQHANYVVINQYSSFLYKIGNSSWLWSFKTQTSYDWYIDRKKERWK